MSPNELSTLRVGFTLAFGRFANFGLLCKNRITYHEHFPI
jgi:hypothetical protein